jgi:hypothetical protein
MPTIPKKEFVMEHKKLVKILASGTPAQQKKEAKAQLKELQKYLCRKF